MNNYVSKINSSKIKALREARGWSIMDLSRETGLTWQAIGQMERSSRSMHLSSLTKLSHAFQVPVEELVAYLRGKPYGESDSEVKKFYSKFKKIGELAPADQSFILELVKRLQNKTDEEVKDENL